MFNQRFMAGDKNGASAYYKKVVIPLFMDEWGMKDKTDFENRKIIHDILISNCNAVPGFVKSEYPTVKWEYIKKCERLFFDNFNGSFPSVKDHGYDRSKI